jgi:hypothetical protein
MFYFQNLLSQGLAGIDRTAVLTTITGIAYTILLIGFLIGLYQAALRGGDVQSLGIAALKYLVVAILLANWSPVFREVNDSFNQVAQFISNSSGAGDMFLGWLDQLKQQFENDGTQSFLSIITATPAAAITVLLIFVAYVLYAVAVIVFGFFYTLYGCLLYTLGPLVLALLPMAGVGQLAKAYATNLMIWNTWGILYAVFGALITAIQANRISDLFSFMGFFTGTIDSTLLGLISIFYALAMIMIPIIANRIISGDVGSSAFALVRAAGIAVGVAESAGAGFAAGAGASGAGAGSGAGGAGAGGGSGFGGEGAGAISSSMPPPQPSLAQTIRSGMMSAVSGATPPAPPVGADVASTASSPEVSGSTAQSGSGSRRAFRPIGPAQTAAFHAGRVAGSVFRDGATDAEGGNG